MKPKLKFKDNSGAVKESRYLSVFEGLSHTNLLTFDIETKKSKEKSILSPGPLMKQTSFIALLPDDELCCTWNSEFYSSSDSKGISFIIDKNYNIKQVINFEIFKTIICTIYYDGDIYFFGSDQYWLKKFQVKKHSLSKKRLRNYGFYSDKLTYSHCDIFENFIIIAGHEEKYICLYDIFCNSFTSIPLDLKGYSAKVVCSWDNRAYIISMAEGIYESGVFNPYEWVFLNKSNINSSYVYGVIANYKECCYFLHGKTYYWFNFKDKTLNRIIRGLF